MDVLSASFFDNKIAWYENDGNENFTSHKITTNADGANSVYAADVNSDGDMDVLSASFEDGKIAWYENLGPATGVNNESTIVPDKLYLYNNYPNPFNPETNIKFDVTGNLHVTLKVFDLLGREVETLVDEQLSTGQYKVTFNAQDLTSGVYFYQIRMGNFHSVKKMVLIR
jgi:hypothetical protein